MKNLTGILALTAAILLGATACSTCNKSSALQGSWSGREMGFAPETPRTISFSGNQFEYRGADPNDWGKGTFVLQANTNPKQLLVTLSDCGPKQYVGKTSYMIYKIEKGMLTMAANEPGNPAPPASFEASGARHMVFERIVLDPAYGKTDSSLNQR